MEEALSELSGYARDLPEDAKRRYLDKLMLMDGMDPFLLPSSSLRTRATPAASLPLVEASDIVSYLVLQTSFLSAKQFKSYKSLEAYNQFVNGWVKNVQAWNVKDKIVVTGRVRHSQRCSDTPLTCWILCLESGEVCCAHCTCMAGLGEACTHVGSVLFYLEASTKINQGTTCTQQKCTWVIPSYQKEIPYLPVKDVDFTCAKRKREEFNSSINSEQSLVNSETVPTSSWSGTCSYSRAVCKHPKLELFFSKLAESDSKPGILSVIDKYSDAYIPKTKRPSFPKPLQQLFHMKYLSYKYTELLEVCSSIEVVVTPAMADLVEMETRDQANSKLWFTYRAGRVTASKMKSVCCTDSASPSQSLIKVLVYPEAFRFTSKYTAWGCKHEKRARDFYEKHMQNHHSFSVSNSGFRINPKWPHIGATPDDIVSCSCCGKGVVEIKCPYCQRSEEVNADNGNWMKSCLKVDSNDNLHLDHKHAYYYQVQTQIFVCDATYCDFVVCTFPNTLQDPSMHVERMYPSDDFWLECEKKASEFFQICILPEILGHWYTRPPVANNNGTNAGISSSVPSTSAFSLDETAGILSSVPSTSDFPLDETAGTISSVPSTSDFPLDETALYCYCKKPDDGLQMIACDNQACAIEWFHTSCLKIKSVPKGKWYCPTCRTLPEFKLKRKRSR